MPPTGAGMNGLGSTRYGMVVFSQGDTLNWFIKVAIPILAWKLANRNPKTKKINLFNEIILKNIYILNSYIYVPMQLCGSSPKGK